MIFFPVYSECNNCFTVEYDDSFVINQIILVFCRIHTVLKSFNYFQRFITCYLFYTRTVYYCLTHLKTASQNYLFTGDFLRINE